MPGLIVGRLVQMAATLLAVSALVWLVMGLMPGDPADLAMMSDPALTAADIERLRAAHGLDRPMHERYLAWLSAVLRGEFGFSRFYAVESGTFRVDKDGVSVATLGAGRFFGEIALLRDVPRTATVVCTEPGSVVVLDRDVFLAAMTPYVPPPAAPESR